jgi:hypothetical protein
MKVFISYGGMADQVTALRLQALAAVNGLTVYVPPAYTRQDPALLLVPESVPKLNEADVVLGVVRAGFTGACRQELDSALALRKATIVMADPVFAPQLQPHFGLNLVLIDPAYPDRAELAIVERLRAVDAEQNAKKALLALGTLALGLLIFAPQD